MGADASVLGQVLHQFFDLGHVHLEVFVALELRLHRHDVLCVPNLTVVHLLEILLELVQLGPELLTVSFDRRKTLLRVLERVNCKFALHFLQLCLFLVVQHCEVVSSESARP